MANGAKKYCRPKLHIMRPSLIKNSEMTRFMMSQKIILALDESDNSMKAVNYVGKIVKSDDKITLFSVLPGPTAACSLENPSLITIFDENKATFCAIEDKNRENINELMEKVKRILIASGVNPDDITVRIKSQEMTIAKDILKELKQGQYDNIVRY